MIEDAPLLTKTVKINQSEGIPGSGIPERTFVKNSYKRSRTSLPSPPLLLIAFFTSHRSPLSERLEQAILIDVPDNRTKVTYRASLGKPIEKPLWGGNNKVCMYCSRETFNSKPIHLIWRKAVNWYGGRQVLVCGKTLISMEERTFSLGYNNGCRHRLSLINYPYLSTKGAQIIRI